ncbi:MAG: hypothetical protein PHE26_12750 [Syntrophomonadaceae bacterium]|nr:hypothetical protein [Syntrophomonadaceae bacterium]
MIRKKRENTRKVMLTLSEEMIEWGKIQAVKEKISFSEFVDNLIAEVKKESSRLKERREGDVKEKRLLKKKKEAAGDDQEN